MAKEPPIQVVNKPRSRKKTSGKGRRLTKKKQGFKPPFQMPVWLHYLLTGVVSVCIILGFYWFFIRPCTYYNYINIMIPGAKGLKLCEFAHILGLLPL